MFIRHPIDGVWFGSALFCSTQRAIGLLSGLAIGLLSGLAIESSTLTSTTVEGIRALLAASAQRSVALVQAYAIGVEPRAHQDALSAFLGREMAQDARREASIDL